MNVKTKRSGFAASHGTKLIDDDSSPTGIKNYNLKTFTNQNSPV